MGLIKINGFICERCQHKWVSRKNQIPIVCPKCKNPYWNIPKNNKKRKNG